MSPAAVSASLARRIAFIGGGNMAEAIIGGLIANSVPCSNIVVSEPLIQRAEYIKDKFGVHIANSNITAVSGMKPVYEAADVVIIAVKPNYVAPVIRETANALISSKPLVISIAAGVCLSDIERWLTENNSSIAKNEIPPLVRCMPNTPALVLEGASGVYASPDTVNDEQRQLAETILSGVSRVYWMENESLLDPVTAVSGSGPAYFFMMLEAMEKGGIEAGLTREQSRELAIQTCLGAAKMAMQNKNTTLEQLRINVTSPNGTTEAALKVMMGEGKVHEWIQKGVIAASKRSTELGQIFGKL
ncbi:pyrroline-5-carboxylate reductase [Ramicandelaber brevisporus]|nr:pyrroline-5-carboxylate reductase [Ramicandelaber brevisporus]